MADFLAVIPARGGSRRIAHKNLRPLAGYPLIEWTLAVLATIPRLPVLVSSDDPAILALASHYPKFGFDLRPERYSGDDAGDLPLFQYLVRKYSVAAHAVILHLRPTAPFRRREEIIEVAEFLQTGMVDSVRSVIRAPHPPQKMYLEDGLLVPATWDHGANDPDQILLPAWLAAGFIDAVRASTVMSGSMEGALIAPWEVPEERAVDLNSEADWAAAERLAAEHGWTPGHIG